LNAFYSVIDQVTTFYHREDHNTLLTYLFGKLAFRGFGTSFVAYNDQVETPSNVFFALVSRCQTIATIIGVESYHKNEMEQFESLGMKVAKKFPGIHQIRLHNICKNDHQEIYFHGDRETYVVSREVSLDTRLIVNINYLNIDLPPSMHLRLEPMPELNFGKLISQTESVRTNKFRLISDTIGEMAAKYARILYIKSDQELGALIDATLSNMFKILHPFHREYPTVIGILSEK